MLPPERDVTARRELQIFLDLTRAIARTRTVEEIYAISLDALTSALHVSRAAILLFDPDGVMRFKAYRGLSSEYRAAVQGHSPWTPDSVDAEPLLVRLDGDPSDGLGLGRRLRQNGFRILAGLDGGIDPADGQVQDGGARLSLKRGRPGLWC